VSITVLKAADLLLYNIQDHLRSNSELLGHDRVWIAMNSIDAFAQSAYCVMNAILIERMVLMVKGKGFFSAMSNTIFGTDTNALTSRNTVSSDNAMQK
jgi:hypothetical protein